MLLLQPRDRDIFALLLRLKVATLYQIKEALNLSISRQMLSRRLNELCSEKYLEKMHFNQKVTYGLLEKAVERLLDSDLKKTHQTGLFKVDPKKLSHDLLLTEIYLKLKDLGEISGLKTHNDIVFEEGNEFYKIKIPDGLFQVKNKKIALELEITAKAMNRYKHIFTQYYSSQNIDAVLYLVEGSFLKEKLLEIEAQVFKFSQRKIFVGDVYSFLKEPLETAFLNSQKKVLLLSRI